MFDFFDENNNYEAFEKDKAHKAKRAKMLEECGYVSTSVDEIPVDDETTEADFVR